MKMGLGLACLFMLLLTSSLAFYGLIQFGGTDLDWGLLSDPYFYRILSFSLQQAFLSALLAGILGWLVARALYYLPNTHPRSQRLFLALCLLCFVLPTLILITGLVALLGRSGWLSPWLGEDWNLYGLQGILLAHVFLNLPFVVRALYLQLTSIADSSWQLALQLKLSPWQRLRWVEWPVIHSAVWGVSGFVFVLCFNSFAVVLALGGGAAIHHTGSRYLPSPEIRL